jgi:chromosome condensin MukBEF complex kleisin-like MukF subunit
MMDRLIDFRDEAVALRDLEITFFPENSIIKMAVNIRQLTNG